MDLCNCNCHICILTVCACSWLTLCRLSSVGMDTVASISPCHCVESRPSGVMRLLLSSSVSVLTEGDREVLSAGCLLFVVTSWPVALPCILFSSTRAFLLGIVSPLAYLCCHPRSVLPAASPRLMKVSLAALCSSVVLFLSLQPFSFTSLSSCLFVCLIKTRLG